MLSARSINYFSKSDDNTKKTTLSEKPEKSEGGINKESLNITKEENNESKIELNKVNKDSLLVLYEKDNNHRFSLYDNKNTPLGSFNMGQLIKYVGNKIDPQFLVNINSTTSNNLIERLICEVTDKFDIKLRSYYDSPFMGNLEIIIKLINALRDYENNNLEADLNNIETTFNKKKIRNLIKQFIYNMLNYTLRLIESLSTEIKNKSQTDESKKLKDKLIRYSVAILYRINSYVKFYLDSQISTIKDLETNLEKMLKIKNVITDKINDIGNKIESQNSKIDEFAKSSQPTRDISLEKIDDMDLAKLVSTDSQNQFKTNDTTIKSTKDDDIESLTTKDSDKSNLSGVYAI